MEPLIKDSSKTTKLKEKEFTKPKLISGKELGNKATQMDKVNKLAMDFLKMKKKSFQAYKKKQENAQFIKEDFKEDLNMEMELTNGEKTFQNIQVHFQTDNLMDKEDSPLAMLSIKVVGRKESNQPYNQQSSSKEQELNNIGMIDNRI